ncbi:ion channel [Actinocrispum sp. NPDC049592]|uniref:potassium channel family protein n=1 Tax=Actinocrispum sp. NPDC049592 TaxID=3154835 RepID=UPI003438CB11
MKTDPEWRLAMWERRTEWPLTGLAAVFLGAYAWQVLKTDASPELHLTLEFVLWSTWVVFAADYLIRLSLARHKGRFFYKHLFDLLAVALPMVRELRVLRLVTVIRVLNRRASSAMRGRVGIYVATITALICFSSALAVLDAERGDPESGIQTFPQALWWTLTTISTVGYGDLYPHTWGGRLVAASLMVGGIALLGVITGMIASWFLERIRMSTEDTIEESIQQETDILRDEMTLLRAEIARLHARLGDEHRCDHGHNQVVSRTGPELLRPP